MKKGTSVLRGAAVGSAWTGVPLAIAAAARWGYPAGLGFATGLGWALVNLWVIAAVVRVTLTPRRRTGRAIALLFVKFAIYGAGVLLLVSGWFPPAALIAGFSWLLAVIVLRAAGAMMRERAEARNGDTGARSGGE